MDGGFEGKTYLVTGASGGIGGAVARAFAAEGARLVVHYHSNAEAARSLSEELETDIACLGADLTDEGDVAALFEGAIDHFGRIDGIVANAGRWSPVAPLHELTLDQWQEHTETNLQATFLTCREFFRHLASVPREEASVVSIGSTAAVFGEADHADYSAAKAGLTYGLTRTLKNEITQLAPRGRVNCVCPGWTATPMADVVTRDPKSVARATRTMSMRKIATPEDIAHAVLFLSSDNLAGHVSGEVLTVAGGMEGRQLHE